MGEIQRYRFVVERDRGQIVKAYEAPWYGSQAPEADYVRFSDHLADKAELSKQLAELTEQFRRLKSECDGISDSYVSLRSEYDEQTKQLAAANELLSSIRQENRRLAEQLAAANEQIAALTEMASDHGLTPQSSKSPLGYLSSLITEQKRETERLRAENRKLALAVASQTMRIAELERQPEALTCQNGELHD